MFFIGAGGLWGGLIFFIIYALRSSRRSDGSGWGDEGG
jgi:hypothetical protein